MQGYIICWKCNGIGTFIPKESRYGASVQCPECRGIGKLPQPRANIDRASRELVEALGVMIEANTIENREALSDCIVVFCYALAGRKDPWIAIEPEE